MRTKSNDQLGFVFDEVTEITPKILTVIIDRSDTKQRQVDDLTEQIRRDMATLKMDAEMFHHPSREFYEQRIEAYREEIKRIKLLPQR